MGTCIIDNGYTLGCASIGGVEEVYLATFNGAATFTLDTDDIVVGCTSYSVYKFEQDSEYAGLAQNGVYNRENGTVHYESILSLKFIDLDASLRNSILALGKAPLFAVIKSVAGVYYIAGVEVAGRATAGTASLGTAYSDMNGATLEVTWKSQNGVYLMDAAVLGTDITII
tara:strand:+ start:3055 stop:3567 length:513 start_codon:yes stop_codon:yes gene_type:complete